MPTGPKLASVHSGARAPLQSANWAFCNMGEVAATKGPYGYGLGTPKVIFTVRSSSASTFVTSSNLASWEQPPAGSRQYSAVNATSAAVTGLPSDQSRPSRSLQVTVPRSGDTPPLATVGTEAASQGTRFPDSSNRASGSRIIDAASTSLVPPER